MALLAAVLFGASTPLVQEMGKGLGPLTTAALLYGGAAMVGLLSLKPVQKEARLLPQDWRRLATIAALGAAIGPVALAWGLQHTSGAGASLMLTLEALFTALLARWLYGESLDNRVRVALMLLGLGSMALILDQQRMGTTQLLGLLAVALATAAWGADSTLSRELADRDPGQVVLAKSVLGCIATGALAVVLHEPLPAGDSVFALLAIGASGYGLSLKFYLLAQRRFGAARTGSVFAFAPFIGAVVALGLGDRGVSWMMALGCILMLAGVAMHLSEHHDHAHQHESLEHEHAHTHDDGHHMHRHEPMPAGSHSHAHVHDETTHAHPHAPDLHHQHRH